MTTRAQKVRAGAFAAIAIALGAIVLIVFGGLRLWRKSDHYRVVFPGSVMGLDQGALVYLAGIRVGTVDDIGVSPDDLGKVVVTIEVDRGTPVHTDTAAHLEYAGITGLKVIDLQGGTYAAPRVPDGGTIAAGQGVIEKLQQQAEQLVDQSHTIMQRANRIVDNLVALTDPARFAAVDQVLAQANVTATNLAGTTAELRAMVAEDRVAIRRSLDAFAGAARSTSALIDGPITRIATDGDELLAQVRGFVMANERPLRTAVFDLAQASRSLKDLVRDVRARPSRLIFSSAPEERKLP